MNDIVKLSIRDQKKNDLTDPVASAADFVENTLAHRASFKQRREQFLKSMDPDLTAEQRQEMI